MFYTGMRSKGEVCVISEGGVLWSSVSYGLQGKALKLNRIRSRTLSAPRSPEGDPRVPGGSARGHFELDWAAD